ncbi:polyketide synthase [Aspergillus neoniger CBS 115656]|uniref:Polyketide synthase n=1 Tax=Aspergillus neoniger (strain CBS 115656) TaxID=1448310 RepID=A0A318YVM8_ASPNB|nr:polyketide synthase [Aspergillus neoniger CBS 115656]PYH38566.1 polyketide synthase [Aspergillus neoniger CBS 115656]
MFFERHPTPSTSSEGAYHLDEDREFAEPIAVCGIGLKLPQDAVSEDGFWKMLMERRSARTEFPKDRMNINAFYHPTRRNELGTRGAHFLQEDLSRFDADFFSITPSEAAAMDPMQRLLLETTVEALDTAGIRIEDLQGSRTSVHTGCFSNDYLHQLLKDPQQLPPYAAVGASPSMLANRISWFFNLRGPSFNIDSACSSSALAIDCACRLLLSGQTDMGLAAGCNLLLDPDYSIILSNNHMLSPDGRSYTFDSRANGYSRGEGVAVIVLKRLSDALRNNDTIRAVIRATASNQDGRTPGITQPASEAQSQLIRETYAQAGLSLHHTRFFEAHGTGTPIGDPAEVSAIADCFRNHRTADSPLYLGAVKTNIGHLEGASGIAGVIKAILAVERGIIPPNTNFERLHPQLEPHDSCLAVPPAQGIIWPPAEIRRASINSFGFGGSNCHIVIDDAASYLRRRQLQGNHRTVPDDDRSLEQFMRRPRHMRCNGELLPQQEGMAEIPRLLVWSAASERSLKSLVSRWAETVSGGEYQHAPSWTAHAAYTLDSRRSVFPWKTYAVASSSTDWEQLNERASAPKLTGPTPPRLAFIFTGQGAQWYAMGRELLHYPAFSRVLREADTLFRQLGCPWSAREEFLKSESASQINEPHISQALTATLQIALVDLLDSFQVRPLAVVGHSMGEIAAAYCAGFISRSSALRIAYYRGYFVASMIEQDPNKGAMLAVGLSATQAQSYIAQLPEPEKVVVACINSPSNTTISGEESHIKYLDQMLKDAGIFSRRLKVAAAYHSPQIQQIADDCRRHFANLEEGHHYHTAHSTIPMISTVTGEPLDGERARNASYWVDNLISPVLFAPAIQRLCRDSPHCLRKKIDRSHRKAIVVDHLIEVGPHSALRLPIFETLAALNDSQKDRCTYLSTLVRGQPASNTLLSALGQLHCAGTSLDLRAVNDPGRCHEVLIDAPTYPFDHSESYWAESPLSQNYRLRSHGRLALLGSPVPTWNPLAPEWRNCVQAADMPWIRDHRINSRVIYPAAAMMVMALQATRQMVETSGRAIEAYVLRSVRFHRPIALEGGSEQTGSSGSDVLETRLCLNNASLPPEADGVSRWNFVVYSMTKENSWQTNCQGVVEVHLSQQKDQKGEEGEEAEVKHYQSQWDKRVTECTIQVPASKFYDHLKKHGFHYGPSTQGMKSIQTDGVGTALASLNLAQPCLSSPEMDEYPIHPASLDAFLQLSLVAQNRGTMKGMPTQVISAIDRLWITGKGWANLVARGQDCVSAAMQIEVDGPRNKSYNGYVLSQKADGQSPQLILDRLETTAVSSIDSEVIDNSHSAVSPSNDQKDDGKSWYTVKTDLAMSASTPGNILQYLEDQCGVDPPGPREFFRNVRQYLTLQMQKICDALNTSKIPAKPHLQRYVTWMKWQLAQQGQLTARGLMNAEEEANLHRQIAAQGRLGNFYLTVADHALGVLHGEVDVVQLLFESNLVNDFYQAYESSVSIYLKKVERYVATMAFNRPDMDILEVGAGTGSFTDNVLNGICLSGTSLRSYQYTDISPAFFDRAQQRLASHPHGRRIAFQILDAEQDPLEQGFTENTYDLIVASNALHVTRNLEKTLKALRRLLRPGGQLILHEVTRPDNIEVGFSFGLLPGWWPDATDDRPMSPVVSEARWDLIMRASGFVGAEIVLRDYADEESQLMSVIVATAGETQEQTATVSSSPSSSSHVDIVLVVEPSSPLQINLANRLMDFLIAEESAYRPRIVMYPEEISPGSVIISLLDQDNTTSILGRLHGEESFERLKALLLGARKVLWLSSDDERHPSFGMIDGFAQVFRIENPQIPLQILHMDAASMASFEGLNSLEATLKVALNQLMMTRSSSNCQDDYSIKTNQVYIRRIQEDLPLKSDIKEILDGTQATSERLGDIRPFAVRWPQELASGGNAEISCSFQIDAEHTKPSQALGPDEVEIAVHAVRLDDQLGRIRQCAGRIVQVGRNSPFLVGDRVCGVYYSSSTSNADDDDTLTSTVRTHKSLVARIDSSSSFNEAAVLPQRYLVAEYIVGLMSSFAESSPAIVIHGAHTGIARVVVDLMAGRYSRLLLTVPSDSNCETDEIWEQAKNDESVSVFTYSSFLRKLRFSGSEDGADIVLDFVDSDLLDLANQVAPFGVVIRVIDGDSRFGLSNPQKLCIPANMSLHTVDVAQLLQRQRPRLRMPSAVVAPTAIRTAKTTSDSVKLSTMLNQSSRSTRRKQITIEFDDDDVVSIRKPRQPAYSFDPNATYLLAGGLGDLGRCVAQWMVRRGARYLILLSRSGPRNEAPRRMIEELEAKGTTVYAPACDIIDMAALQRVLDGCRQTMPPIKGCIQMTGVLRDVMYDRMTFTDWQSSVQPKASGSWNLHTLLPRGLDFFILAASLTGLMGQATQINYAAGNAYQDALARYRLSQGERAVSLDLGVLETKGLLTDASGLFDRFLSTNFHYLLREPDILAMFEHFCNPTLPIEELPAQVATGFMRPSLHKQLNMQLPVTFDQPFWKQIFVSTNADDDIDKQQPRDSNSNNQSENHLDLHSALSAVANGTNDTVKSTTTEVLTTIAMEALAERFCQMVLMPRAKLNVEEPFHRAGADSLTAVDLRNWVLKEAGVDLPVFDILGELPVSALGRMVAREWAVVHIK